MNWAYIFELAPILAEGAVVTCWATLLGMVIACLLGLLISFASYIPSRGARAVVSGIKEFIGNTPLLIQIYALYYVLPLWGLSLPALAAGVAALGIQYAAYVSDTYRVGIEAVPAGQWEASAALGMTRSQTWVRVILPQAIRNIVPALGTFMISMFKDSPLLFAIGVAELMSHAMREASTTYRYTEPILMVGFFFLVMSLASSLVIQTFSRKLALR